MKTIKRVISILCSLCITLSTLNFVSASAANEFNDLPQSYACYTSVMRLSELGIINGYEDNTFRPGNSVTRAEFCKMIVAMLDKVSEAQSTPPSSTFDDVNKVPWCIPYVNYLTGNNILKGYADATFRPTKVITYAEAVTIICRVLGYNEEDIGYSWPNNYMTEAKVLGLTDEQLGASSSVTRAIMAQIVDNALFTYVNGQGDTTFLESIGYSVMEDSFILASSDTDASLNSDEIRTDSGVYSVKSNSVLDNVGYAGTLILNDDKEAVSFKQDNLYSMMAVVTNVDENTIEYKVANSHQGSYTFTKNFTIYSDNSKLTYNEAKNDISEGTEIEFFGERDGKWTFAVIDAVQSSVVPVKATKNYTSSDTYLEGTPIKFENLTVYKDNKTVSVADIEIDDVIYYNTRTNVMDVYNKKITGIYTEALPSKAYVTSVNVGGNIYEINPKVSTSSLDASNGSFDIGDRVTLLLGKNDEICFATETSGFDKFEYGVVLKTYSEIATSGENEGSSQIMASVFMPDGNTYEYQTAKNYKDYVGELVKLDYNSNLVSMSRPTSSGVYGDIDFNERTLGAKNVLKDVTVIHRLSEENSSEAQVELLNFDTLDVNTITSSQLITSISTNAFGDVAILYLCDMPSGYQYGYLRGSEDNSNDMSISVTYKIYTGSEIMQYQSSSKYSFSGGAVLYKVVNGKLTDMKQLNTIAQSSSIGAVEGGRIMINNTIYKMSDNVLIIDTGDVSNYKTLSVNELATSKVSSVVIYSDKSASANGMIRVIKVTTKK